MKTTAEYLDLALQFDLLATFERDPKLRADFEQQAVAYRKLAARTIGKDLRFGTAKNFKQSHYHLSCLLFAKVFSTRTLVQIVVVLNATVAMKA
jgi:hypothetical protein